MPLNNAHRLICQLLLLLVPISYSQERKCSIKSLVGTVKIRKGDGATWIDARPNMPLKEKDAVRTFVESEAELATSEGSVLKLGENSTFELSTLQSSSDAQNTKVKLLNGSLISNVKKLVNTKSSFEFETPTATAAIRGTIVGLDVTREKTLIKVYEGKVFVTPQGSNNGTELNPNQMASVIKGQKEIKVEQFEGKSPISTSQNSDSNSVKGHVLDSTSALPDSLKAKEQQPTEKDSSIQGSFNSGDNIKDSSSIKKPVSLNLDFAVNSPKDGQQFTKPLITVSGTATPGAEISSGSISLTVNSSGTFSTQIPIINEEGEYSLEFEASLEGKTQKISRTIVYKPDYRFNITYPLEGQTVNSTNLQVKGEVLPATAEVSVLGRRLSVSSNGLFTGLVTIPDEEGSVQLEFEVTTGSTTRTEMRTFTYKRPPDTYRPVLQGLLPDISKQPRLTFAVIDRTPDEEITFYKIVDGNIESEQGVPSQPFYLTLQEGIHTYSVYAQDKQGNVSSKLTKEIKYLGATIWSIKMRKPIGDEVLNIPPSTPDYGFKPVYTIEFSIENLPDNNVHLLKDVTVSNLTTGQVQHQRSFTDTYFSFDVNVSQRQSNQIVIDVIDINDTHRIQKFQVHVR
jgi:hypothetical protein